MTRSCLSVFAVARPLVRWSIAAGALIVASAVSCAAQPPPAMTAEEEALLVQGATEFDQAVPAELEVKRAPTGHLLVRPKINGHEPGWFIFDTGAGICVISTPKVDGLELTDSGEIPATGVGGTQMSKLYRARTLAVGPMTLHDQPFMATDLSFLTMYLKDEIAGVIGYGLLSQGVIEIALGDKGDNPEHKPMIALHDPAGYELEKLHPGGAWTELRVVERVPAVHAKFEDKDAWFRLDTGANGSVTFHEPAVKKFALLDGRETKDAKMGGVGGFVSAKTGELAWFELGGVRHEKITAMFATEAKGAFAESRVDGNIGAELLRPFVMVLDYKGGRAAFVKRNTK